MSSEGLIRRWLRVGRRPGLRWRATIAFALGGLVLSAVLSTATYVIARGYLIEQRENSATRQAYADASVVRQGLLARGSRPADVISNVSPREGAQILLHIGGQWFSSELGQGSSDLPPSLVSAVADGSPGLSWARVGPERAVVVGTPLPAAAADFFEVSSVGELDRTLAVLRTVLLAVATVTAGAAALLGWSVARRVIRPLDTVAATAAAIAGGRITTRLPPTDDPELVAIVGSFNAMVDALASRIEREARFTADVSHELRSPLTAMVTGVELLGAQRSDLSPRSQRAFDLIRTELDRFRRTLEDLLELARMDAGTGADHRMDTGLVDLVRHALLGSGRDPALLIVDPGNPSPGGDLHVLVNRRELERALLNLFDNADRHADGVSGVLVRQDGGTASIMVDDAGPGVPVGDRERIFSRFARVTTARGSTGGTGLGLSLVAETAQRHGGTIWCSSSPDLGARFVLQLPLASVDPPATDEPQDDPAGRVAT